jgi:enterochelin esterase-like enzyme
MTRSNRPGVTVAIILVLAIGIFALLQIDLVHQYVEIGWIAITGKEWRLKGDLQTIMMWSPALKERRNLIIYTPPGYSSPGNATVHYPVLYLLHGSPDPGFGWYQYGRAQEDVDRLIVLERYPPMIVVMPNGNGQGTFGDSEYIDAPAIQRNGQPGLKIGTYITHDVVDWIDSHYRTIRASAGRLIGGVSSGGYGAANLGLQCPQIYGYVFSYSGYYQADPTGWARPVWGYHATRENLYSQSPNEFVTQNSNAWRHTYVILGDGFNDRMYYRRDTDRFYNELKSDHIEVTKIRYPGRHSWDLWRALLRTSLRTVRNRLPNVSTVNQ